MGRMGRTLASLALAAALLPSLSGAQTAAPPPSPLLADVARFDQPTNAARFDALTAMLTRRGLAYEVQRFAGGRPNAPVEGRNVVVTLGSGSREIVLGAHYDAVIRDGQAVDGLVDNAASVVALAQAAERLKGRPLRHTVRIVFFDQEEIGLIGSKAWLAARRTPPVAAVNFDVNGYGDTLMFGGLKSDARGELRNAVRRVCTQRQLDCLRFDQYPPSDDLSFSAAGVPVVSIGFQPALEAHRLWVWAHEQGRPNPALPKGYLPEVLRVIHTPEDKLSRIQPATLETAAAVAVDMVLDLDRTLGAP